MNLVVQFLVKGFIVLCQILFDEFIYFKSGGVMFLFMMVVVQFGVVDICVNLVCDIKIILFIGVDIVVVGGIIICFV